MGCGRGRQPHEPGDGHGSGTHRGRHGQRTVERAHRWQRPVANRRRTTLNAPPEETAIDAVTTVKEHTGTVTIDTADVPVDSTTEFPVVIDPTVTLTPSFDTYVSNEWLSDRSTQTELLIGTPNSGSGKYRSFMNVNVASLSGRKSRPRT